jgi:polyhydroxybutyrate depolymerase
MVGGRGFSTIAAMARNPAGPFGPQQSGGLLFGLVALLVLALAGYGLLNRTEPQPAQPAAAASPACATPPAEPVPAVTDAELTDQGVQRQYRVTVPPGYDPGTPAPVILLFHGTGGTPDDIEAYTGLVGPAGDRGYVVVTPQGVQRQTDQGALPAAWDVPGFRTGVDDVAFVEALLAEVGSRVCLDGDRVYGTGISAGGAFPAHLACESDRMAGIAPVAGANLIPPCPDGDPVSFLGFHGTADIFVSYQGIGADGSPLDPTSTPSPTGDGFFNGPAPATAAGWAQRAGCGEYGDETVASDVMLRSWSCPAGVAVALYTVTDGGHTWPGADPAVRTECCGVTTSSIDANSLMLDFFDAEPAS